MRIKLTTRKKRRRRIEKKAHDTMEKCYAIANHEWSSKNLIDWVRYILGKDTFLYLENPNIDESRDPEELFVVSSISRQAIAEHVALQMNCTTKSVCDRLSAETCEQFAKGLHNAEVEDTDVNNRFHEAMVPVVFSLATEASKKIDKILPEVV